jgi:hypothetical protein
MDRPECPPRTKRSQWLLWGRMRDRRAKENQQRLPPFLIEPVALFAIVRNCVSALLARYSENRFPRRLILPDRNQDSLGLFLYKRARREGFVTISVPSATANPVPKATEATAAAEDPIVLIRRARAATQTAIIARRFISRWPRCQRFALLVATASPDDAFAGIALLTIRERPQTGRVLSFSRRRPDDFAVIGGCDRGTLFRGCAHDDFAAAGAALADRFLGGPARCRLVPDPASFAALSIPGDGAIAGDRGCPRQQAISASQHGDSGPYSTAHRTDLPSPALDCPVAARFRASRDRRTQHDAQAPSTPSATARRAFHAISAAPRTAFGGGLIAV